MKEPIRLSSVMSKTAKLDSFIKRRGDYENEYIFTYSGDYVLAYSDDRLISYSIAETVRRLEVFRISRIAKDNRMGSVIDKRIIKGSIMEKEKVKVSNIQKQILKLSRIDKEIEK